MDETNVITFEVENYRKGTIAATVTLTDGVWSSDSEFGQSLIDSANRLYADDEAKINHFSTWTNQSLASRRVNPE